MLTMTIKLLKREIQYFFAAVKVVALLIFAVVKEEVEGHLVPGISTLRQEGHSQGRAP